MTPLNALINRTLALLAPPQRFNVAQWADARREIARGSSAEPGKYKSSRLPYQREPMEAFTDPTVIETVLVWARQLGKTTLIENLIGFIIDVDPANVFVKYPTKDKAKDFSQKKLTPMVKTTPGLKAKIKNPRSRDSGNTIYSKLFPGGSISMVGANSAAALRQLSCRVVIQDEIDSDQDNQEGDPVPQADATSENFHDAILVKSSTPTIKPVDDGKGGRTGSRIQILFDESDQRFWNVACPRCAHWQVLKWANVRWTWNRDGVEVSEPENAVYVCDGCRAELSDFERVRMIMLGKWVAQNPHSRRRGYHLSGLYRIMGKKRAYKSYLHEFVEKFLKAKREGSIDEWTNMFLAECSEVVMNKLETDPLLLRREKYGPELPKQVLVLTCAVDVQSDRLECLVMGHGLGAESWGIRLDLLMGNPYRPDLWKRLDEYLQQEFVHPIEGAMKVVCTVIDSGGQVNEQPFSDPVYRFVRPRQPREIGPGVYALKGGNRYDLPLVTNRRPKKGICLKIIGTTTAKSTLHARLRLADVGPRYCHFPLGFGFDEEFFAQLGAEAPRTIKKRGYTQIEWHKLRTRNEGLDLMVYSLAAIEILNADLPLIAEKMRGKDKTLQLPEVRRETLANRPVPGANSGRWTRDRFRHAFVKPSFKR